MNKVFTGLGDGTSMVPLINKGDRVTVELVPYSQLKINDIVVFFDKRKKLISHRIILKNGSEIFAKGDNVCVLDDPILVSSIIGRVRTINGKYGKIDLASFFPIFIGYYLLFFSLVNLLLPIPFKKLAFIFIRGRKQLVRLSANPQIPPPVDKHKKP